MTQAQPQTPQIREYRYKLTTAGQASPAFLGEHVVQIMRKAFIEKLNLTHSLSILDIGCGLGHQMALIKAALPDLFGRVEGIDWSPATVEKHNADPVSVYDKVTLCGSDRLPYPDRTFDIALSMENLEHLYGKTAINAIGEMTRVAKYLVITTPLPQSCVNHEWLYREMAEAILDPVPLDRREFICLESAVHKSCIFPQSMRDAGFVAIEDGGQAYYVGTSMQIDATKIKCVGIEPPVFPDSSSDAAANYKDAYLTLLASSVRLQDQIVAGTGTTR